MLILFFDFPSIVEQRLLCRPGVHFVPPHIVRLLIVKCILNMLKHARFNWQDLVLMLSGYHYRNCCPQAFVPSQHQNTRGRPSSSFVQAHPVWNSLCRMVRCNLWVLRCVAFAKDWERLVILHFSTLRGIIERSCICVQSSHNAPRHLFWV